MFNIFTAKVTQSNCTKTTHIVFVIRCNQRIVFAIMHNHRCRYTLNPIGLPGSSFFSRSWSSASLITSICRAISLLNCDSGFKMPFWHLKADNTFSYKDPALPRAREHGSEEQVGAGASVKQWRYAHSPPKSSKISGCFPIMWAPLTSHIFYNLQFLYWNLQLLYRKMLFLYTWFLASYINFILVYLRMILYVCQRII